MLIIAPSHTVWLATYVAIRGEAPSHSWPSRHHCSPQRVKKCNFLLRYCSGIPRARGAFRSCTNTNASVVGNILVEWQPTSGWLKDHVRVGPMPSLASFGLSAIYIHHRYSIIDVKSKTIASLAAAISAHGVFLLPWHAGFHFLDLRVSAVCPGPTPCRASHLTLTAWIDVMSFSR